MSRALDPQRDGYNVPIASMTDSDMNIHAASRGLVLLTNGAIVHLVRWRGTRRPNRADGTSRAPRADARVCGQREGASHGTVKIRDIVAIVIPRDAE